MRSPTSRRLAVALLALTFAASPGCKDDPAAAPGGPATSPAGSGALPSTDVGYVESLDGDVLVGWAWNSLTPNDPVSVDVWDGPSTVATAAADVPRDDLAEAKKGNGKHGFRIPLPPALRDGRPHAVHVTLSGTRIGLAGSPRVYVRPATAP